MAPRAGCSSTRERGRYWWGRPNAGKSSLLNALLEADRAIVTPIPGTTRDVLTEPLNLDGVPVTLVDTAGIAERTDDAVERLGVERSRAEIGRADVLLLVLDGAAAPSSEDAAIAAAIGERPGVVVLNKADLPPRYPPAAAQDLLAAAPVRTVSALTGDGIAALRSTLARLVVPTTSDAGDDLLLGSVRHVEALRRAADHLAAAQETLDSAYPLDMVTIDLRGALDALGEVTGHTVTEDLLDIRYSARFASASELPRAETLSRYRHWSYQENDLTNRRVQRYDAASVSMREESIWPGVGLLGDGRARERRGMPSSQRAVVSVKKRPILAHCSSACSPASRVIRRAKPPPRPNPSKSRSIAPTAGTRSHLPTSAAARWRAVRRTFGCGPSTLTRSLTATACAAGTPSAPSTTTATSPHHHSPRPSRKPCPRPLSRPWRTARGLAAPRCSDRGVVQAVNVLLFRRDRQTGMVGIVHALVDDPVGNELYAASGVRQQLGHIVPPPPARGLAGCSRPVRRVPVARP